MINIIDGELIDYMPLSFKHGPEAASISFALKQTWKTVWEKSLKVRIFYAIDNLPEDILDYLATDFGAPYYDDSFPIETKRKVVKEAINSEIRGGTVKSIETILSAIYGSAKEEDWYEYGGQPGHFRIVIDADKTIDMSMVADALRKAKRISSVQDVIRANVQAAEEELYLANVLNTEKVINLGGKTYDDPEVFNLANLFDDDENIIFDAYGNIVMEG